MEPRILGRGFGDRDAPFGTERSVAQDGVRAVRVLTESRTHCHDLTACLNETRPAAVAPTSSSGRGFASLTRGDDPREPGEEPRRDKHRNKLNRSHPGGIGIRHVDGVVDRMEAALERS
jgi:hypothetical protein